MGRHADTGPVVAQAAQPATLSFEYEWSESESESESDGEDDGERRNTPLKRVRYHSQSRMGQVHKPRTRLTVVLEEVPHGDPRAVGRVVSHRAGKVPNRPRWVKPVMDAPEPGV